MVHTDCSDMIRRMNWIVVGLGNPGAEYEKTRHNAGRMAVSAFMLAHTAGPWREDHLAEAQIVKGSRFTAVLPDTYMNKSGNAVKRYVKSVKAAGNLVVVYDDIDLPLGKIKISFDRSSGGHNGLKSLERALKTRAFYRVRVGISPHTASGKTKKPRGEDDVLKFLMGPFRPAELDQLKTVFKKVSQALSVIIEDDPERAMNQFN